MSNGTDEIRDIRKRLEETERAIGELRAGDLAIMKIMAAELCEMHYNTFILSQKGEEIKKYTELWSKRLADTKQTIEGSETIKAIIETRDKFVKAISDSVKGESVKDVTKYVKEEKVDNADEAMEIAHYFFKEKGKTVALPMKAVRQNDVWLVDIDVGAVRLEIATVKIDAKTGDILSHEITQKK
jgi:hypothetical protein